MGVEVGLYSFLNLGARWGGWSKPRPGRFTPASDPVHIVKGPRVDKTRRRKLIENCKLIPKNSLFVGLKFRGLLYQITKMGCSIRVASLLHTDGRTDGQSDISGSPHRRHRSKKDGGLHHILLCSNVSKFVSLNIRNFDLSGLVPTNRDKITWLASRLPRFSAIEQIARSSVQLCPSLRNEFLKLRRLYLHLFQQ
jgi:hypothetical protein